MTPRGGDAEARRAVILDAALRVFGQYGYRRTSMDDIAREAGIGKGTIYLSFASKEEVFQALAQRLARRMLAGAEAASRRPGTTADKLAAMHAAWFGTYAETISRSPHAADLLDAKHQLSANLAADAASRYKRLVQNVLTEAATAGELDLEPAGTHSRHRRRAADRRRPRAGTQHVLAGRLPAPAQHARPGHDRRAGQQAPRRSLLNHQRTGRSATGPSSLARGRRSPCTHKVHASPGQPGTKPQVTTASRPSNRLPGPPLNRGG